MAGEWGRRREGWTSGSRSSEGVRVPPSDWAAVSQAAKAARQADATSIVATEFVTLMDEAAEGRLDEVDLPRALLARRSGCALAVLLSSELGVYPAAGMDGVRRRKAVLASTRGSWELGREPTAN